MADIRRFSDNGPIENGTANKNLSLVDIVPMQHTSDDGHDYQMSISQFQGTPVVEATYTNATSPTMAYNGTCKNFPDIGGKLVQGQHVLIKFLRNNTSTGVNKTTINLGGYTYELQLQGSAMPTGYIAANAVIDFTCLTATSDTTKTGVLVCQNSVSQVNSALANYQTVKKYNSSYSWNQLYKRIIEEWDALPTGTTIATVIGTNSSCATFLISKMNASYGGFFIIDPYYDDLNLRHYQKYSGKWSVIKFTGTKTTLDTTTTQSSPSNADNGLS